MGCLASLAVGSGTGGTVDAADPTIILLFGAASGLGSICFCFSNLVSTNLGVNGLSFVNPALALGWLALFTDVHVPRVGWFVRCFRGSKFR